MISVEHPPVAEIRKRIADIQDIGVRRTLMATYLFAARISEVVSYQEPGDIQTHARGPKGTDLVMESVDGEDVALFNLFTAKRNGLPRIIALPLNFEPWARELVNHYRERAIEPAFPYTRQQIWKSSKLAFRGYEYPIEAYVLSQGINPKSVPPHYREFAVHALRHLRATELVQFYNFDTMRLSLYLGWGSRYGCQTSGPDRYVSLDWRSYLPNLLKRRME